MVQANAWWTTVQSHDTPKTFLDDNQVTWYVPVWLLRLLCSACRNLFLPCLVLQVSLSGFNIWIEVLDHRVILTYFFVENLPGATKANIKAFAKALGLVEKTSKFKHEQFIPLSITFKLSGFWKVYIIPKNWMQKTEIPKNCHELWSGKLWWWKMLNVI